MRRPALPRRCVVRPGVAQSTPRAAASQSRATIAARTGPSRGPAASARCGTARAECSRDRPASRCSWPPPGDRARSRDDAPHAMRLLLLCDSRTRGSRRPYAISLPTRHAVVTTAQRRVTATIHAASCDSIARSVSKPSPCTSKTSSTTNDPPMRAGSCTPAIVTVGTSALRSAVDGRHPQRSRALRARRAHVVLRQRLDHRRPLLLHHHGDRDRGQGDNRQPDPGAAEGGEELCDEEGRDRIHEEHRARRHVVDRMASSPRGKDPIGTPTAQLTRSARTAIPA